MTDSLLNEPVEVYYNEQEQLITLDWKGYQTLTSVQVGLIKALKLIEKFQLPYILSNHKGMLGTMTMAHNWIEQVWKPRAVQNGCKAFAFIYAVDAFTRFSTDQMARIVDGGISAHAFYDINTANAWLCSVREAGTAA